MPTRTKIIGCSSGLCNRLRVLSNWYGKSEHIRMLWPINTDCPAFWTDMFEPIQKVNFVKSSSKESARYKPKVTQERYLSLLDIKPVFDIPKIEQDYVGVHIRKTDLVRVQKQRRIKIKTENDYIEEAEAFNIDLIYLATDNAKSQNILKQHFKDRLIVHEDIKKYGSNYKPIRCTSMQHAVTDLYTCTYASKFVSTLFSSFSGTINLARLKLNEHYSGDNNGT